MQRILVTFLVAAACLAGCPKPDTTSPDGAQTPAPAPEPLPAPAEPDPGSAVTPPEAMPGLTECTMEIALQCDAGSADGCLSQKTTRHVCVPDSETAGPPCEQEIAKVCPPGQVDACQIEAATMHLCVYEPPGTR